MNEMHKNRYTKYSYSKTDILVSREREDRKEEEVERGIDLERKERPRSVCVFYKNGFWWLAFFAKVWIFWGEKNEYLI